MRKMDTIGFQDLYRRYADDVYRFAYWLCGDPDDAKDITSETFVRVWTADTEIRMDSVKGYLLTIARNLYLHQHRRKKRLTPMEAEPEAPVPAADTIVGDRAALDEMQAALLELPEIDRTLLLMRAEEELSYADIARATGLSLTAAKVRVFRARTKLQTLLHHLRDARI